MKNQLFEIIAHDVNLNMRVHANTSFSIDAIIHLHDSFDPDDTSMTFAHFYVVIVSRYDTYSTIETRAYVLEHDENDPDDAHYINVRSNERVSLFHTIT